MLRKSSFPLILFLIFSTPLLASSKEDKPKKEKTAEELAIEKLQKESKKIKAEEELKNLQFKQSLAEKRRRLEELELNLSLEKKETELALKEEKERHQEIERKIKQSNQEHQLKVLELEKVIKNLALENKLNAEKHKKKLQELQDSQLQDKIAREKLVSEQLTKELKMKKLEQMLKNRAQREKWDIKTNTEMDYPSEPFQNGILRISDRRLELNGPIYYGTADYITERIHFFNNKSQTDPIFIVINRSPGGSVMEGYRILKAMESSAAPIHVLVKSFAASMAAAIATLASHSYAYENAVILHHQVSGLQYGNITEQSKSFELIKEWGKRLHKPIAEKMGLSLEAFYKKMYENDPKGDWEEFGNKAKELKWVDHLVTQVVEESYNENPNTETFQAKRKLEKRSMWDGINLDAEGKRQEKMLLPKLDAFDFYFIHNNNQYTW